MQMCKILLSINPQHVEKIMNGKKLYEFRKIECKEKVEKIVIYSTAPVMKIVGEADVDDIIVNQPELVWKKTFKHAGVSKDFFDMYYKDKNKAVAFKLTNVKQYENPKELSQYGIKYAPQSFVYI